MKRPILISIIIVVILIIAGVVALIMLSSPGEKSGELDLGDDVWQGPITIIPECLFDAYNCGNFTTQAEAQEVFDYCFNAKGFEGIPMGDIHGLDNDGDGIVCESLG